MLKATILIPNIQAFKLYILCCYCTGLIFFHFNADFHPSSTILC